jgi:hypothetical protein
VGPVPKIAHDPSDISRLRLRLISNSGPRTIPGTTGASGISEAWSAYPNTPTAHATTTSQTGWSGAFSLVPRTWHEGTR